MFKGKGEVSIINKVLIVILVVICVLTVAIILLTQLNKKNIKTYVKETQGMIANNAIYAVTEENTWDVSANGDGSVIATLSEDGTLTISGTGNMKNWTYYDTTDWHNSEIKEKVKKVIISNGVTSIVKYGFDECNSLISIKIPSSVTSLGYFAFYKCSSLIEINIPEGVTSIGNGAFHGCSGLKSITIPNSVTLIHDNAFAFCSSLTNIIIQKEIISIGKDAFRKCENLTILCYSGSTAETYAIENNIKYQIIYLSSTKQEIDELNLLIKGIQPNTTVEELKKTLQSEITYEIINLDGDALLDAEIVSTKHELKLENGTQYKLIVCGDTNGDGQATIKDILSINKHRLKKAQLVNECLQAGDIKEDGKVDLRDILQINKYRLGKISEL